MSLPGKPLSIMQARVAAAESSGALARPNAPWKAPRGVRRAATITTDSIFTGAIRFELGWTN